MLTAFNSLLAQVIALALLLEILAAPFLALWVALSIRRNLQRIADAVDFNTGHPTTRPILRVQSTQQPTDTGASRISTSAFGR